MSKNAEEPMDISSTVDSEAFQSSESKKDHEEKMDVEETVEVQESQRESISSTSTSPRQTEEIIEAESDERDTKTARTGVDTKSEFKENDKITVIRNENIENLDDTNNEDVDMECTSRDETDKRDITEKTSDNEEAKVDRDKELESSDNSQNTDDDNVTSDNTTEIDSSQKSDDVEIDHCANTKKVDDETAANNDNNKIDDIPKETDNINEKTGDNIEKTVHKKTDNKDKSIEDNEKIAEDDAKTVDDLEKTTDYSEETNKKNEKTNVADEEIGDADEITGDDDEKMDDGGEKTDDDGEKLDDNNEKTGDDNEKTGDGGEKPGDTNEKTNDGDEEINDISMETDDNAIAIDTSVKIKGKNKRMSKTVDKDTSDKGKNAIISNDTEKESLLISKADSIDTDNERNVDKDNDSVMNDQNSIFVHVNTETNEKDESEKPSTPSEQVSNDVDPIGSTEWSQNIESTFVSELDEADECIIPDTNREDIPSLTSKETQLSQSSSSSLSSDPMQLNEKYLVRVASGDDKTSCMICDVKTLCKYICSKDNIETKICSEDCLSKLKTQHPDNVIVHQLRVKNFSLDKDLQSADNIAETTSPSDTSSRTITCINCQSSISNVNKSLSWETLDFCDEQCLTKHQKLIGSFCANCKIDVKENFLGKYCVRFGYSVRQFCSSTCLEEYKKSSKVCSFCQDDISGNTSGFLTSIGGLSKDFCSANCMQKFSEINKQAAGVKVSDECCVCHKTNTIEIEFEYKSKNNLFCGEPCFVAFKYVNDVKPEKCDMCCKYFIALSKNPPYLMRYDGIIRKFCLESCQNIYITTNRKIVSCCWCKVKKYNFDMIQKYVPGSTVLIVCSVTCLNFFNASLNATKIKKKRCDFCNKICKGQYHITLADDSMKNFCSYPCVQEYQSKYLLAPARYTEQPSAVPSQTTNRVTTRKSSSQQRKQIIPDVPGPLPIITSVRSLAPTANQTNTRQLRSRTSAPAVTTITTLQTEPAGPPPLRRVIVLRPPDLPLQRNIATLVKPITCDVEVEFKPIMVDKAVQTEDLKDSLVLVPIPVPIYVPSPMQMFQLTHTVPMPFPFPIPIPMFVPITKQTAGIVLKEMKKAQIRTDPYEADLLMMAELVAGEVEKKENPVESESEAESAGDNQPVETYSPEPPDASNTFGDDMLQMALKMATDFEEPAVDLEGALTANTITATAASTEPEEVTPIQPPVERMTFRGRRRGRPPRHGGRGRGRGRPPTQPEPVQPQEPEPQQPTEPPEKPDANMCLKYTFGVNAWKQWVTTKNAELERTSRRSKSFKTDLLQLTSDELNYSLCLFVKEVRKPNGAEYAPDTIYYLCLGIQQYLFENGRIDNIFCDSYYESFTDCLDEVCRKFSTLYNDSQYIVTRVEEEHLWESKQLGAHSPHVLLSTLMFFNTKHFNLTNVEEHMQLSFSHIMKHWKRVANQTGTPKNSSSSSRNILLRFYPPQSAIEGNNRKKKVYEQQENEENPLRCPVKLYEFYLSKCPESVKTRNDVFYLLPERSCVPDSPVWYSTMALGKEPLEKMLHRVKMVKEINIALLAS